MHVATTAKECWSQAGFRCRLPVTFSGKTYRTCIGKVGEAWCKSERTQRRGWSFCDMDTNCFWERGQVNGCPLDEGSFASKKDAPLGSLVDGDTGTHPPEREEQRWTHWWFRTMVAQPCPRAPMLVGFRVHTRTDCCSTK